MRMFSINKNKNRKSKVNENDGKLRWKKVHNEESKEEYVDSESNLMLATTAVGILGAGALIYNS